MSDNMIYIVRVLNSMSCTRTLGYAHHRIMFKVHVINRKYTI